MAGLCRHGNERSVSIKCEEFLDKLRNYQLFKKGTTSYVYGKPILTL
jgi:hypothetical protein